MIAGAATGWLVTGTSKPAPPVVTFWREASLFGALGALPDIDLLFGAHSGLTHSFGATAIVGLVALAIASHLGASRPGRLALACAAAYASHVLLDWLGSDASPPLGIMALWPFSRAYYESNLHVFMAITRRYDHGWAFVAHNVRAVCLELLILVPILALVARLRHRRTGRIAV